MIDRLLRRLTVRRRIVGGFLVLLFLLSLTIPLIMYDHLSFVGRLRQIADVEARADRLLLLASTHVASSRVNLMRYIEDYALSPYESLNDIERATELLTEAQELSTSPEQRADVAEVLEGLADYRTLVNDVQAARLEERTRDVSQLLFQAYRLGTDIGQRIEQIVTDSEARLAQDNETFYTESQRRLIFLVAGYVGVLILALILANLVQRSITRPVAELRSGAEAFSQGRMDATIPVVGVDELSLLAQTFNQMAAQLRDLIGTLEQRVADRTRELERRSSYLEAAAEVGRAATSILEADRLIQQTVELVRRRFGLYYVGLFTVDETGEWAVLRAGTGEAGQAMLARGHRLGIGTGMVGWSIANAQARVALEVGEDAERLATAELPDTRSEAALPLRSRGQVVGALTVQSDRSGAFDQETIVVLQTMADQVAVALDNAHLFTASQAALEAERRAYGDISSGAWTRMARAQPDLGFLSAPQGIHQIGGPWRPEMIQASRTGQTVRTAALNVALPIRIRDHVVGVVRLQKPDAAGEWTADEVALLETLTDQLGMALESARLYQDTQRRATHEQLVGEVTARMRATLDMESVLKTAADEMYKALGLDEVVVRLAREE